MSASDTNNNIKLEWVDGSEANIVFFSYVHQNGSPYKDYIDKIKNGFDGQTIFRVRLNGAEKIWRPTSDPNAMNYFLCQYDTTESMSINIYTHRLTSIFLE